MTMALDIISSLGVNPASSEGIFKLTQRSLGMNEMPYDSLMWHFEDDSWILVDKNGNSLSCGRDWSAMYEAVMDNYNNEPIF